MTTLVSENLVTKYSPELLSVLHSPWRSKLSSEKWHPEQYQVQIFKEYFMIPYLRNKHLQQCPVLAEKIQILIHKQFTKWDLRSSNLIVKMLIPLIKIHPLAGSAY